MNENQRTVTLPTIPKEVADSIENLRHFRGLTDGAIISIATRTGGGISEASTTLQTIPLDVLIAALVNGYVVEKSEEERRESAVKREWLDRDRRRHRSEYCDGFADGIEFVLGEFSVEIEGVNA
jgi:hypothetical protein